MNTNVSTAKNQNLGPGTYNLGSSFSQVAGKRTQSTACFLNQKEDNLFGVIEGAPAPTDYDAKGSNFEPKFWATNMQAFGQTEKRFAQAQGSFVDLGPPGPGHYSRQIKWLP